MQLKLLSALTLLVLASGASAFPIQERAPTLAAFESRAITIHPTFISGMENIQIPVITAADQASASALRKKQNKIRIKTAQQKAMVANQQQALTRIEAVLNAAAPALKLSGALNVQVTTFFHTSNSDIEKHATFEFDAPICAPTCTGHAYNPTAADGQLGRIFNKQHKSIFGGEPKKP